ncbi:META domain-containing protein [Sphingomonas sp. AOB5]|uniref:META domain-containing protein n=1 Tax=Sphingomonas sp. AOB5 TaxID=3034017 RepID=UPI0023F8BC99|nr:META domain-containing protein [Sphingomonas sp. AOB5]MDF7775998.1 META domain-containing protein [Sphingomonas sp. AOB5]
MKTLIAAAAALTVLASPALAQRGGPYKAVGTEPFWGLTIDSRTMKFETPDRRPVTVPTPRVINGFAGEIYKTRRIDVNIVHRQCSDGMSDRTYSDTVTVTVDGRRYSGCGGDTQVRETATVIDGNWRVLSIGGIQVGPRADVALQFQRGRVTGNTGCNSLNGSFRLDRGFLTAGPLATTRRACMGNGAMALERALIDTLGQRLSVSQGNGRRLVMTARGGKTLVLERARQPGRR